MSAFGNLSGSEDYHVRALQLNADKVLELATRPKGQVKAKEIAMTSVFYGKFKAHYYSLADKAPYSELYRQTQAAYNSFLSRVGVVASID